MNILEPFQNLGEKSYYERRKPALIFCFLIASIVSCFSVSTSVNYSKNFISEYIGMNAAIMVCYVLFIIIDIAAFRFLVETSKDTFRHKYFDGITFFIFLCCFGVSLFTSIKGVEAIKAAKSIEAVNVSSQKSGLSPIVDTSSVGKVGEISPLAGGRNVRLHAIAVSEAEKAKTERLKIAASLAEKQLKHKDDTNKRVLSFIDKNFTINQYLLYIFQLIVCVFAICVGYIQSRKNDKKEAKVMDSSIGDDIKEELRKIKQRYISARAEFKKDPDNEKAGQRMAKYANEILKMGGELPEVSK